MTTCRALRSHMRSPMIRGWPRNKRVAAPYQRCGAATAKLRPSERVFTCDACGHTQDRDLNGALNLVRIAQEHAQAERIQSYVARIGRLVITAILRPAAASSSYVTSNRRDLPRTGI